MSNDFKLRGSAPVAEQPHKLFPEGSIPSSATNFLWSKDDYNQAQAAYDAYRKSLPEDTSTRMPFTVLPESQKRAWLAASNAAISFNLREVVGVPYMQ